MSSNAGPRPSVGTSPRVTVASGSTGPDGLARDGSTSPGRPKPRKRRRGGQSSPHVRVTIVEPEASGDHIPRNVVAQYQTRWNDVQKVRNIS